MGETGTCERCLQGNLGKIEEDLVYNSGEQCSLGIEFLQSVRILPMGHNSSETMPIYGIMVNCQLDEYDLVFGGHHTARKALQCLSSLVEFRNPSICSEGG